MFEPAEGPLSGDLARLSTWWHDHAPGPSRSVARLNTGQGQDLCEEVDRLIDSGCTIVVVSDADDAAPEDCDAARATIAKLTRSSPSAVVDQSPSTDDLTWMQVVAAIRDKRSEAISTPTITALGDAFTRCSQRRTPVLFDGLIAHAAALTAAQADTNATDGWLPAATSSDPAIALAQRAFMHTAALDLRVDGTGQAAVHAVLAVLDVVAPVTT